MTRTETVNGDLFRRLESRIKALEQAVTLLSKIAKVDVSKLLQSGVDDKNSSSNNNGPGIGGNAKFSTFSSSVLPPSEAKSSGKAPLRQFSVRKLRIKIRSLEAGSGNNFQSSSTPTFVPPIPPGDQEEVQLETKKALHLMWNKLMKRMILIGFPNPCHQALITHQKLMDNPLKMTQKMIKMTLKQNQLPLQH
ncbi:hypothetical protein Ocin01_18595 [Orchesella cincta]|uniref:Uncharacterized protein n=1 Tax=Orchesella cincta TaxID=48709 RepID=A0A1D2M539_ORCCI|nr:hypothetical protein Ocin01_18595 [Orchesella cincta]